MINCFLILNLFFLAVGNLSHAQQNCAKILGNEQVLGVLSGGVVKYRSSYAGELDKVNVHVQIRAPLQDRAPILLFLNGLTKQTQYWDQVLNEMYRQAPGLMKPAGVIRMDLLGQGLTREKTDMQTGPVETKLQVEAIQQVLRYYQKKTGQNLKGRVVVIGHSYGTAIAAAAGNKDLPLSKAFKKMILVTPFVDHLEVESVRSIQTDAINFFIQHAGLPEEIFDPWRSILYTCGSPTLDLFKVWLDLIRANFPAQYQAYKEYLTRSSLGPLLRRDNPDLTDEGIANATGLTLGAVNQDMRGSLNHLQDGIVVDEIVSRHDELIPFDAAVNLHNNIPQANHGRLYSIDAVHNAPEENPNILAIALIQSIRNEVQ